ncbi:MAG: hypothetical protein CMO40_03900 [Verrucomicrobiaceae bacterium]|nr:hypothetical protein [Verrucomicrobiaceae bacterium]
MDAFFLIFVHLGLKKADGIIRKAGNSRRCFTCNPWNVQGSLSRTFAFRVGWTGWAVVVPGLLMAEDALLLPETIVAAERRLSGDAFPQSWGELEIEERAPRTIDEMLAGEPSFSLYRRQTSLFGNPTSGGVSLRRTGATAAARSLVLRDGVPQNDPFGGWISWARYRPELLSSVRVVPGAKGTVWGNQSPAGVIQLTGREFGRNGFDGRFIGGAQGTSGMSGVGEFVSKEAGWAAQVAGFSLQSDGFHALRASQRGAVDRPLDLLTRGLEARAAWQPNGNFSVEPVLSFYDEERGNGTELSRNSSEALDFSLRVTLERPGTTWQAVAYYQRREFASLFSAVDEARNTESPALDQFEVPGEGLGGSVTATMQVSEEAQLIVGSDLRILNGETNELAGFVNGRFLRQRRAGGSQMIGGLFARAACDMGGNLALDGSARIDFWNLRDGERVESRPATGALLRQDRFRDREGVEPSLSAAVGWSASDAVRLRASAGTAFRLPTINELYRPFRVRNDITEANPALAPERFVSVEAGVDWNPLNCFSVEASVFHHWIHEAIANVPVTDADEASQVAGFIPPGGSVAQRRNVKEAHVLGLESRARWNPSPCLAFTLRYLLSRSEFVEAPGQTLLEGKRFPQSPRHRLVLGAEFKPLTSFSLYAEVDFSSGQYDDALERRYLDSWWSVRLGGRVALSENVSLQARVENLLDEEITTGLSSSGLQSFGSPRSFWLSVACSF